MEVERSGERLGRPGVWIAGRALILTLIVLLAITFDRGGDGTLGGFGHGSWPYPLGYLSVLACVYLTTALYFALGRRRRDPGALAVLAVDVPVVTAIIHWTGGIDSHYVLIYLPLGLAAGFLRGIGGGLGIAVASAACYLVLLGFEAGGWIDPRGYGGDQGRALFALGADAGRVVLNLTMLILAGLLAGALGRIHAERSQALRSTSRKLARARQDASFAIDHLVSGLLSLDEGGRIQLFNRAAGQILGVEPAAVIGRTAAEALPARAAAFIDWLEEARAGRTPLVRQEIEIERPGEGSMPLGMTGSRTAAKGITGDEVIDSAGDGVGGGDGADPSGLIVLFQDLTRARQEEAERVRKERLAVIGGLAGGITHEIRNCVKPISGSLDVLMRELELSGPNQRLMELAVRECSRLGHFVQAMLDYGRVNPLVLEPAPLDELVSEVGDMLAVLEQAAPHTVRIQIAPQARGACAQIDREQVKQVLFNLALNGLEAMGHDQGTLTIALDVLDQAAAPVDSPDVYVAREALEGGVAGGTSLALTVRDTGPGMDRETCAQVFEPFFTTKRGGTGFGLAIAASIIERHGGGLEVESAVGRGCLFRIRLHERIAIEDVLAA